MKMIFENWSRKVFQGFCNSIFDSENMLSYYMNEETQEGFTWDFIDYSKYQNKVGAYYVENIKNNIFNAEKIDLQIFDFTDIWSPREYNFYTNKLSFSVKFNLAKLKKYCFNTCKADFEKYLCENWTSYNGFVSFTPNTIEKFKSALSGRKRDDCIQVMLEFFLLQNCNFDSIAYCTYEDIQDDLPNLIALQSTETWDFYDYEYDNNSCMYKPLEKIA